jgi:hypothetical protein
VLLRQVQARPLQGHHLRALRRRGDAAEGAPRAHGAHRPRRSGLAHLVLQGRPEPHRLPARHRPARAREGPLLRRFDRDLGRRRGAAEGPERPRGQGQGGVGADLRRPRREPRRARGPAEAAPRVFHQGQGAQLRRGRRVLGARPVQLGRGAGLADPRRGPRACREDVCRGRLEDHHRGLEEDPRARAQRGHPRRPAALAQGAGDRRQRRDSDPRVARAPQQGARQGNGLEEGRDHQAHQPHPRRAARPEGRGARGGPGARRERRCQAAREGSRARQGPPAGGARAGRLGCQPGRATRAHERPLPAHRREDLEGGPRRDRPVGDQGPRGLPGHRGAQGGREGGRGRRGAPARGDLAALPRARAEDDRQRRADLPRAQGPFRVAVRLRPCARRSRRRRARSSSARSSA